MIENSFNNHAIILVRPQLIENVGFTARIMKNFNFNDLRIINPRFDFNRENEISTAARAQDIIKNAKIYKNVNDAIKDINILYAISARKRDMNKEQIYLNEINNYSNPVICDLNLKAGYMFGPENNGLSNEDLILANKIITIKNNDKYPSLNIAHAATLICYEIFNIITNNINNNINSNNSNVSKKILNNINRDLDISNKEMHNNFYDKLFTLLDNSNFFIVKEKKEIMTRNIKNIFTKSNLTKNEISILMGMISSLNSNKK